MPLLSTYEVLANISDSEMPSSDMQKVEENPTPIPTPLIPKVWKPKWEKALLQKFIRAAMEETPNSLKLKVEIETTDTVEKRSITALIDLGATGNLLTGSMWRVASSTWWS